MFDDINSNFSWLDQNYFCFFWDQFYVFSFTLLFDIASLPQISDDLGLLYIFVNEEQGWFI